MFGNMIIDSFIKNSDRYGISFNSEGVKQNIATLDTNWVIDSEPNKFEIIWNNTDSSKIHKRKIIKYGYFGPSEERDYFGDSGNIEVYESRYNFDTKKFNYYCRFSGVVEFINEISKEEFIAHTK